MKKRTWQALRLDAPVITKDYKSLAEIAKIWGIKTRQTRARLSEMLANGEVKRVLGWSTNPAGVRVRTAFFKLL